MTECKIDAGELAEAVAWTAGKTKFLNCEWRHRVETLRAAAESLLPRVKEVEVWRVEWAIGRDFHDGRPSYYSTHCEACDTEVDAKLKVENLGRHAECVRVTGPHKQQVPA